MCDVYSGPFVRIEWNGSATYNVFSRGKNVNCFTVYYRPESGLSAHAFAVRAAREWMIENVWNGER